MNGISTEYAVALFSLALEEGKAKEYGKAIGTLGEIFRDEPDYLELLSSPAIGVSERLSAIEAAFTGNYPENIVNFLMLLCEKGRMRFFGEIADEYERLLSEYERVSEAVVTSAQPLDEAECEKLRIKLRGMLGHEVNITNVTDKSVIGGLVIEVDGKLIDGSIRGRLAGIKEVISK